VARVVTINAAADRYFAIAIGTGEIHAQTDLVDARIKAIAQRAIKRIESLFAPTLCKRVGEIHETNLKRVNKKTKNTQGEEMSPS
jgi:hypothetical protein